eukprot:scaffold145292_cov112-Phaeocystis_antarctica.AAC.2
MSTSVVTPAARVVLTQLHAIVATEPVAKVTIRSVSLGKSRSWGGSFEREAHLARAASVVRAVVQGHGGVAGRGLEQPVGDAREVGHHLRVARHARVPATEGAARRLDLKQPRRAGVAWG